MLAWEASRVRRSHLYLLSALRFLHVVLHVKQEPRKIAKRSAGSLHTELCTSFSLRRKGRRSQKSDENPLNMYAGMPSLE